MSCSPEGDMRQGECQDVRMISAFHQSAISSPGLSPAYADPDSPSAKDARNFLSPDRSPLPLFTKELHLRKLAPMKNAPERMTNGLASLGGDSHHQEDAQAQQGVLKEMEKHCVYHVLRKKVFYCMM